MGQIALRLGGRAILGQIIIAVIWAPTYAPANPIEPEGDRALAGDKICTKPVCQKLAEMMNKQMGDGPPCHDFYDYVCGKWEGDSELKSAVLKKKAVVTLADLLKKASESREVLIASKKLIRAFKSCINMGKDQGALEVSIRNVIARYNVTNKPWPIIDEMEGQPARGEYSAYADVLKKTGPRPVFSYSVSEKDGKPIILMTRPSEFYVQEVDESGDYAEYADEAAEDEKKYKKFIKDTITLLNKSIPQDKAEAAAAEIIRMEKGLSKLASEASRGGQKMTLSELGSLLGDDFPMTEILKQDFQDINIEINGATEVFVEYIDYLKKGVIFMKCNSMESLSNYIFWAKIRKMAEAEGTLLHKLYLRFKRNSHFFNFVDLQDSNEEKSADEAKPPRLQCVRQLLRSDIMYTAGANYYIRHKFNKNSKENVQKLMTFINSSFMNVVKNNTWMSESTKEAAIMMLQKTNPIIGYLDWMLNETIITSLYGFVPEVSDNMSYVEHFHYLVENDHKQTLLKLDSNAYFNKANEDIALKSHAYYDETTHTLVYPAAALVTHYNGPPIPRAVNYGAIGTILAQLLVNIIDRYNYAFNGTQRYNDDTWDDYTKKNFCNRSSCLNNTEECNDTITPSSDKYEKLQDYLGVRISYEAMLRSETNYSSPFLLPDKDGRFNSESKIFFTFFGNLYCPFSVNEQPVNKKLVQSRADDGKDFPDTLKEIVRTYKEFNVTFNCSVIEGADTCSLMPSNGQANPNHC